MSTTRRALFVTSALLAGALFSVGCGSGGAGSAAAGSGNLVTLVTPSVPGATTGVSYATQFEATFVNPPGVFQVTGGALPLGLNLDIETGELAGFPRQTGAFHFEIAARDGVDRSLPPGRDASFAEDRKTYDLVVDLGPPNILPQTVPAAQYRASYAYQIDVAGGTKPYTFTKLSGTLPKGMAVSSKGVLGTFPTSAGGNPYTFLVEVTDANGLTDTETMSFDVVVLPLIILTSTIPEAAATFPYDQLMQLASTGAGAPLAWTQSAPVAGETLLSTLGMEISADGHLRNDLANTGPTTVGTFLFTLDIQDEALQHATRQYSLKVNAGPVLTSITPNSSIKPGPYAVSGANFQPGAKLYFKPGPSQITVTPTVVNASSMTIASTPAAPSGGGAVTVRVVNPDGGFFDKPAAFNFPFVNLSFGTKGFISSPVSSTGLDCADISGDGLAEVIHCGASGYLTNSYSSGATSTSGGLRYYKNLGSLAFTETILDSGNFYDCKFADLNTDGKIDVVALGQTQIKTWLNTGGGTLVAGPVTSLPSINGSPYPAQMAVGFLNSDSIPDLAFSVATYPNTSGQVHTMKGDGAGGFTLLTSAISNMGSTYGVNALTLIDYNLDGRMDVVAPPGLNYSTGPYFRMNTTASDGTQAATWSATANTTSYYQSGCGVEKGNVFGDGRPAVVACTSQDPSDGGQKFLTLWSGTNLATQQTLTAPGGLVKCVHFADFDLDGKDDFGVSYHTSGLAIYRASTLAVVQTLDATVGSPTVSSARTGRVATGDLDGDGRIDVLVATSFWNSDYQPYFYSGSYALGLGGDGNGKGVVFYLNSSN